MNGWLINMLIESDRFVIIILKFFKFGIVKTDSNSYKGISVVIGIWKLDFQFNISFFRNSKLKWNDYEPGRA